MSHDYDGSDPIALPSVLLGKGSWVSIVIPDDDDDRDAASYGTGLEGVTDRTVWIAWRMVNGLENNTALTAYPANIWWSGDHTFAAGTVVTINGVLTIPGGISGNVAIAGGLTVNTTLTVNGATSLVGTTLIQNVVTYSGNNAYRVLRRANAPGSTATVDAWKMDLLMVPDLAADAVYTLAHPPSDETIELTVYWLSQTGTKRVELKDGSRTLCVVDSSARDRDGRVAKIRLVYEVDGGWAVTSVERGRRILFASDSNLTINAWEYDLVIVPDLAANRLWTFAQPPAGHGPFETEVRWRSQVSSKVLTLQTVGALTTLSAITAGSNTANGIATAVVANDGQGTGTNGVASYYVKSQRGPY